MLLPGALLHVLKLFDGVNLILSLKCWGFMDADEPALFERSNSDSHISWTANIWGITASRARGSLIIGCHFMSCMPFPALVVSKGLWFNQMFVRLVDGTHFKNCFHVGSSFLFHVCRWALAVKKKQKQTGRLVILNNEYICRISCCFFATI